MESGGREPVHLVQYSRPVAEGTGVIGRQKRLTVALNRQVTFCTQHDLHFDLQTMIQAAAVSQQTGTV